MQRSGSGQPSLRRAHEILDVPADADAHQIARAYRRQARRFHPDLSVETDATERFWALQAAYRVALDAVRSTVPPTPVVPRPRAQVADHDPIVVLGVPPSRSLRVTTRPEKSGIAWLVAGPVHVRSPQRPNPAATPGTEPGTAARSPGEGP
jgi:hypothetical protein